MTYQRELLIWPVSKEAECFNYCDVADAAYADYVDDPEGVFCQRQFYDRHGQHFTAYYGPTGWGSAEDPGPPEPPECLAARGDAVLATTYDPILDD